MFSTLAPNHDVSEFAALNAPAVLRVGPHGRRTARRALHRAPCRLHLADEQTGHSESLLGETVNICPHGLAVQIPRALPVGARVEVLLPDRHGEAVCPLGRVAHCRRILTGTFEIGVRFEVADTRR